MPSNNDQHPQRADFAVGMCGSDGRESDKTQGRGSRGRGEEAGFKLKDAKHSSRCAISKRVRYIRRHENGRHRIVHTTNTSLFPLYSRRFNRVLCFDKYLEYEHAIGGGRIRALWLSRRRA
jgi:hypothetical protein